MTDKEKCNAIATECGWESSTEISGCWRRKSDGLTQACLPDYFNDLNAMHEAEKVLWHEANNTAPRWLEYRKHLYAISDDVCHATAAQRVEAFGKTLNLW
jgi:hypothetical protein